MRLYLLPSGKVSSVAVESGNQYLHECIKENAAKLKFPSASEESYTQIVIRVEALLRPSPLPVVSPKKKSERTAKIRKPRRPKTARGKGDQVKKVVPVTTPTAPKATSPKKDWSAGRGFLK